MFDNDASICQGSSQKNPEKTLAELFEELLELNPNILKQICLQEQDGSSISYQDLNCRANKLAGALLDKLGTCNGDEQNLGTLSMSSLHKIVNKQLSFLRKM